VSSTLDYLPTFKLAPFRWNFALAVLAPAGCLVVLASADIRAPGPLYPLFGGYAVVYVIEFLLPGRVQVDQNELVVRYLLPSPGSYKQILAVTRNRGLVAKLAGNVRITYKTPLSLWVPMSISLKIADEDVDSFINAMKDRLKATRPRSHA
jgi:hypothetical protein